MVINLSKTFLRSQTLFIVWNQTQMIFVWGKTGSREGSCLTSKVLAKLLPRIQKLYQITYIFCNTVSSISIQPFDTNSFALRETFALQCVFRYTYCIKLLLSIFNSSEKKLPNLESHFLIIDTSWKNKALIISTQIFWMVINL